MKLKITQRARRALFGVQAHYILNDTKAAEKILNAEFDTTPIYIPPSNEARNSVVRIASQIKPQRSSTYQSLHSNTNPLAIELEHRLLYLTPTDETLNLVLTKARRLTGDINYQ